MKTLVYISTIDSEKQIGVAKKISLQCEAISQLGYNVLQLGGQKAIHREKIKKISPFYYSEQCKKIKETILNLEQKIDIAYIRHSPSAIYGLLDIMATIKGKNPEAKVVLEFPTYPYEQECFDLKSKPMLYRDRLHRKQLKKYVDHAVTFSPDKEIYGIPAIEITNGTTVSKYEPHKHDKNTNRIDIIAVAGISKWHGFDRIISGLSQYYAKEQEEEVCFHIVGDGPYKTALENLTEQSKLSGHVIFYGPKSGDELQKIYNKCDIAIGSLGLHRIYDFPHVSVLKTREYCSIGIPFVSVPQDYIFCESSFPFSLTVPSNDLPVCIEEIKCFIHSLYSQYDSEAITKGMREFAMDKLEWIAIYEHLFGQIGIL